ncbi:PIN domain-containing protein [Ottowia sp.]|uniref:PIN domain-containing protein n=1 Tax=Ottowia sp. TaxID=1898956 RepID=UPI003A841DE9
MRVFVDTNLWVYWLDQRDHDKSRCVAHWLRELANAHDIVISTQVLIEFRAVLMHKFKPAFSAQDVRLALSSLAAFEVVPTHVNMVLDAHELAQAEQLSWFDALIAEAALRSRCAVLYSEDFSHGQRLGGQLLLQNPLLPQT